MVRKRESISKNQHRHYIPTLTPPPAAVTPSCCCFGRDHGGDDLDETKVHRILGQGGCGAGAFAIPMAGVDVVNMDVGCVVFLVVGGVMIAGAVVVGLLLWW